jgi:ABC-type glutathione transport system ATPase component
MANVAPHTNHDRAASSQDVEDVKMMSQLIDSTSREARLSLSGITKLEQQDVINALDGKLCVRSHENAELSQVYDKAYQCFSTRENKYFVLVSGEAGSGKTTVATSLKDTVDMDGGYFATGRFDAMSMEPYAAFAMAFTDFTNQVVEQGQVQAIKAAIHSTVKSETALLTNMVPALEMIIGPTADDHPAFPSQDSASRFALVFRLYCYPRTAVGGIFG